MWVTYTILMGEGGVIIFNSFVHKRAAGDLEILTHTVEAAMRHRSKPLHRMLSLLSVLTHARTHAHTHAHAHVHTHTHKCARRHTHTHTHTHTPSKVQSLPFKLRNMTTLLHFSIIGYNITITTIIHM